MGMFDYVIPECALPDDQAKLVMEWQTKTFDAPFMDNYRIGADGQFYQEIVHYEDRSDKSAPEGSLARLVGCMTPVHDGWEPFAFDGVLNFYGSTRHDCKGEWIEYDATFVNGKMTSIQRLPDRRVPTASRALGAQET